MYREDGFVHARRLWMRLHETAASGIQAPLLTYAGDIPLRQYRGVWAGAGQGPLFRTVSCKTRRLADKALTRPDTRVMVRRRRTGDRGKRP